MKALKPIALGLLIAGGLNWGLTLFNFNLVDTITTALTLPVLSKVIYGLVGLAAVYELFLYFK